MPNGRCQFHGLECRKEGQKVFFNGCGAEPLAEREIEPCGCEKEDEIWTHKRGCSFSMTMKSVSANAAKQLRTAQYEAVAKVSEQAAAKAHLPPKRKRKDPLPGQLGGLLK